MSSSPTTPGSNKLTGALYLSLELWWHSHLWAREITSLEHNVSYLDKYFCICLHIYHMFLNLLSFPCKKCVSHMHSRTDASMKLLTYCICPAHMICACGIYSICTSKMHIWDFWVALHNNFQVEKEVVMRKTVTKDSLMLVKLTTLLIIAFTVLKKKATKTRQRYFHPDDSITWWGSNKSFQLRWI